MATPLLLLLILLAPEPVCLNGPDGLFAGYLLQRFNGARTEAGRPPVAADDRLCRLAAERALQVGASGSPEPSLETLSTMTRQIYRHGYAPHRWRTSTLVAGTHDAEALLRSWRKLEGEWWSDVTTGEFEHFGLGLARHDDELVCTVVFAFSKRSWEWQEAAPLADLAAVRLAVLTATNAARGERRRSPLSSNPILDQAAQRHAEDMLARAYYNHHSPEGWTPAVRVRAAGYTQASAVAENIAEGLFEPEEVVRRWLDSPGHRRNILDRRVREMGVGVAFGENSRGFEVLWVQVFASR